jgi:hypothetical protein
MSAKGKEYIDLNQDGDESIFIPGYDDPVEWEAKRQMMINNGAGCCAAQPIQGETKTEQNMEKFYAEQESQISSQHESAQEEGQTAIQIDPVPQKKETTSTNE